MKTISRYIMTLALLLTAVTGAWADETLLLTIVSKDYSSFKSGSMTFDDKVTITFTNTVYNDGGEDFGWYADKPGSLLTVAGTNGYTITSCKFYTDDGTAKTGYTVEGESPSVYLLRGYVYNNSSKSVQIGTVGVKKIEVYTAASAATGPEVTLNADNTEASFEMPANDATADYELVRDMSVQMTAQVGDGTQEQPRYRVKKDGNKFIPADMEMTAVPALFTVNDAIEQKALTQTQDYIVQIYAIDAEGQPTGEAMTFATFTFEPGIYAVKAVAADGSDYDGETDLSNTFQLFQGYPVEIAAQSFATYYSDEALTLEDSFAETAGLYTVSEVTPTEAVLSEKIDVMPKRTPMLIYNESETAQQILLIPTADVAPLTDVAEEFKGTAVEKEVTAEEVAATNFYVLTDQNQFVWVKDAGTIAANKCWLEIAPSEAAGARRIVFSGSGTTGISTTDVTDYTDGTFYDLNGRKFIKKPTKKGIYIQNGKKVVIK